MTENSYFQFCHFSDGTPCTFLRFSTILIRSWMFTLTFYFVIVLLLEWSFEEEISKSKTNILINIWSCLRTLWASIKMNQKTYFWGIHFIFHSKMPILQTSGDLFKCNVSLLQLQRWQNVVKIKVKSDNLQ